MKVELDLPDWVIDTITRGPAPAPESGPAFEDRLTCIAESWARTVMGWEDEEKRKALYRAFGMEPPDEPDIFL
ncbi:hypothetical protein M527_00285 [Sphingobium indicum IP26]|uniref:Uncharacterized protein n=1 Tax=Sphingobium quisquiliarum P25 TaxID=1329909 RepID=T0HLD3_9SPHN|nr:hypothetical protein M527_00285 [Sphingobium indicum IP26]EQA98363.1 hypothetical protein L288_20525 [Sphingobium quisquiliarum P25]